MVAAQKAAGLRGSREGNQAVETLPVWWYFQMQPEGLSEARRAETQRHGDIADLVFAILQNRCLA
jgi:hypothetical protein